MLCGFIAHRGFKSHRHRHRETPNFPRNSGKNWGFSFSQKSVLGTFWAHFSQDVDDFRARNVTSADRERFAAPCADGRSAVVHFAHYDAAVDRPNWLGTAAA